MPGRRRRTGPDEATVTLVLERAQYSCEVCDCELGHVRGLDWSLHHRIPRGMGGTTSPVSNSPANLLLVCGSGTTGCHSVIESNRSGARAAGWLLSHGQDPTQVPVLLERGLCWQLLTAEGSYAPAPPEDTGLWCIHLSGPDDLIPMPNRTMADRQADRFNQWWSTYRGERDVLPVLSAEVISWPSAPADHAEALAELRADDPDGWLQEPATPETPRVAHRSL